MSLRPRKRKKADVEAELAPGEGEVPGPSTNPATNLLIMDIALRGASLLAARAVERAALELRYPRDKAGNIVEGRSAIAMLAATSAARMATRSVPGFLIVTGGLLAKTLIDRGLHPRHSRRRGDKQLAAQAAKADDESKA